MDAIITFDQLKKATGYDKQFAVEKCLRKNGVRFLYGRCGIYTTSYALNVAMGLCYENKQPEPLEIDIL
jgi:hypothetical protein